MLISKKRAQEINTQAGPTKKLPMGEATLKVVGVEGKNSKAGKPMVVLSFQDIKEEFPVIKEYYTIDPSAAEPSVGERKLGGVMQSFGSKITEANTIGDLIRQIDAATKGKKVKAMIRHSQSIYRPQDGGSWIVNAWPKVAWTVSMEEEIRVNMAEALIPLSAEDQMEWDNYMAKRGGKMTAGSASATTEEEDDLDLDGGEGPETEEDELEGLDEVEEQEEEEKPAPKKAAAKKAAPKKAAPKKAAKKEEEEEEEEDDFDI